MGMVHGVPNIDFGTHFFAIIEQRDGYKNILERTICLKREKMKFEISVIIPVYNAEKYIADAIGSVLAQSYLGSLQILVINDGSSDNTPSILSKMARSHHQISILPNICKKGVSGARNTGLLKATGRYIAFLDADDVWYPNHLEEGCRFFERHNNIDAVFFNCHIFDDQIKQRDGDWFSKRKFMHSLSAQELDGQYHKIVGDMYMSLLDESFLHIQSLIVKKEALNGVMFNEEVTRSEDRDFAIQLAHKNASFAYKNVMTGMYFRRENSLTSDTIHNNLVTVLDHLNLFLHYLVQETRHTKSSKKLIKLISNRYMEAYYCYRLLNNYGLAFSCLVKSVRYRMSIHQLYALTKMVLSFVRYHVVRLIK